MASALCASEYDEKFNMYGNMLYRICMVYLKNPSDVDDAIQDTFVKFLYHAPIFQTQQDEQRWLIRVAVNICKDQLRRFSQRNVPLEYAEEVSVMPETNELFELVRNLSEKYRPVIHLYYTEGFSVEEIARTLSIGVSAVKMRLKRARDILKNELEV